MNQKGTALALWRKPARRRPMVPCSSVQAVKDGGIQDADGHKSKRQVTLVSAESWLEACKDLGRWVDPSARRANILVAGLDLEKCIGRNLSVGGAVIEILGETPPCARMDEAAAGLCDALRPELRAGVYGRVVKSGEIEVGARMEIQDADQP